ncbi:hypothetical protein ACI78T_13775 [Blastococcus sp. SYSU D00922]
MTEPGIDRVLRTRLESIDLVLKGLQELSLDVSAARKGLDDLNDQIDGMGGLVTAVTSLATQIRSGLEEMTERMQVFETTRNPAYLISSEDLLAQLGNAEKLKAKLAELRGSLSVDASNAVRQLRRWSPLSSNKTDNHIDIDRGLRLTAQKLARTVGDTQGKPEPWVYYMAQVQDSCDDLFAQYVDLVGGIALRDQGLDRRVSRPADALVTLLLQSFTRRLALAVPSRHSPQALIQAEHVRIPLPPGWTLWSLPLVAGGVGELLREDERVREGLKQMTFPDLLPDVFGTFVLGPAYAFAAVLFELDPRLASDRRRAHAILRVLRHLDEQDDNRRFSELAGEIEKEWAKAEQVWEESRASGNGSSVVLPDEAGIRQVFAEVAAHCENAAYLAQDHWDDVEALSSALRTADVALGPQPDLRDVLNAMWLARWRHPESLTRIDQRATSAVDVVARMEAQS